MALKPTQIWSDNKHIFTIPVSRKYCLTDATKSQIHDREAVEIGAQVRYPRNSKLVTRIIISDTNIHTSSIHKLIQNVTTRC